MLCTVRCAITPCPTQAVFRAAISEAKRIDAHLYEMFAHRDLIVHVLDAKGTRDTQLAQLGEAISRMILPPSRYTPLLGAGLDAEVAVNEFNSCADKDLQAGLAGVPVGATPATVLDTVDAHATEGQRRGSMLERYQRNNDKKKEDAAEGEVGHWSSFLFDLLACLRVCICSCI